MERTTPNTIAHLQELLRLGNHKAVAKQYRQLKLEDFNKQDQIELQLIALEALVFQRDSEELQQVYSQLTEAELSPTKRCLLQCHQITDLVISSKYEEAKKLIDQTRAMLPDSGWQRDLIESRILYNYSTVRDRAGDPKQGHELLLQSLALAEKYFDKFPRDVIRACLSLGGSSLNLGLHEEAEAFFDAVKRKTAQANFQDSSLSIYSNIFHSRLLNRTDRDYEAVELLKEAEDILRADPERKARIEATLYLMFAITLLKGGDVYEALYYGNRSLQIEQQNPAEHYPSICEQLCLIHLQLKNHKEARKYAQMMIDYYVERNGNKPSPHLAMAYSVIGMTYPNQPEIGSEWQHKSLALLEEMGMTLESSGIFYFFPYQRLVLINSGEEKLRHARNFVEITQQNFQHLATATGEAYLLLGKALLDSDAPDEAYETLAKGLEVSAKTRGKDGRLDYAQSQISYFCWMAQCEALLQKYLSRGDKASLALAIKIQGIAAELINSIRQQFKDEKSKSFFNDSEVLKGQAVGIDLLIEHSKLNGKDASQEVLQIITLNKSSNLHAQINEQSAKQELSQEPKIQLLQELDKQVLALNNEYALEGHSEAKFTAYFEKRNERQRLLSEIEMEYPEYSELKYKLASISLSHLQEELDQDSILLSYFMVEQVLYFVVVKKEETAVVRTELPEDFREIVQRFTEAINRLDEPDVVSLSQLLYQLLINPIADLLFDIFDEGSIKNLVIIPHDCLFRIPFESLQDDQGDRLLDHFNISYHYAANIWLMQRQASNKEYSKQPGFLGIAPVYLSASDSGKQAPHDVQTEPAKAERALLPEKQEHWTPLPFSEQEVQTIAQAFAAIEAPNQNLLHEQADKANVLTKISAADYIHFAAHFHQHPVARLSGLILSGKDKLYLREASNLQLNARLVVLSACESAVGELESSEGMLAITREFLSSGATNVISTLFKVQDEISCQLMTSFYENVLSGQSITSALADAKRALLKQHQAVPTKLWSAFILTGE